MIMAAKVINMPTICLKFRFKENQKVKALMAACASIQQQAVDFAIDNNKTARGVKTLGGKMLPRQGLVGRPLLPVLWLWVKSPKSRQEYAVQLRKPTAGLSGLRTK
jgi:hypothetical protein